jgi:hypothetical protein
LEGDVEPETLCGRAENVFDTAARGQKGQTVGHSRPPGGFAKHAMNSSQLQIKGEADALKRLPAETEAELNAWLPAILDRAFKGQL